MRNVSQVNSVVLATLDNERKAIVGPHTKVRDVVWLDGSYHVVTDVTSVSVRDMDDQQKIRFLYTYTVV